MVACPEQEEASAAAPAAVAPESPRRGARRSRPELVSDLVFRPVAGWIVALLLPLGVSPVVVVCANGLAGLAGAVAIARGDLVAGALLLQLHMLLDNADGQLARASGRSTALGRYLDTEVDLVVNAAVFAALGYVTSAPVLAAAGFLALTLVLSVEFDEDVLHRRVRGEHVVTQPDPTGEGAVARGLAWIYGIVFAPQDRAVQRFSEWRLERVLHGVTDAELRARATRAYYDGMTATVLANLGLSTQLAVLGVCLVLGAPAVYLWLILGACLLLPLLQVRREVRARRVVHG